MSENRNMDDEVMDWIEKGIMWGLVVSAVTGMAYLFPIGGILIVAVCRELIIFVSGIM